MGRRKIEIKPIRDDRNRSVTFLKRKGGLFKKAHELSVLCSVDVAVVIFGHNKKLYEYSSSDINEIIGRFQYYGGAHEHKGPSDFADKNGGDDDDDDDAGDEGEDHRGTPVPDHGMMPAQMQNHPGFQHVRHGTPSGSPPMHNGNMPHFQRGASPLPPGISRPSSRSSQHPPGHIRRTSSNLVPQHAPGTVPPPANYAYMPNPPFYNPPAGAQMPQRPPNQPGPPGQATYPPPFPQSNPPHPQMQGVILQDNSRQSMPPTGPTQGGAQGPRPEHLQPPQQPGQPSPRLPQHSSPQPQQRPNISSPQPAQNQFQSPPMPQPKPLPSYAKSNIFTPIDDSRSMLAQHWGSTSSLDAGVKPQDGGPRSQSTDVATLSRDRGEGVVNGASPRRPPPKSPRRGPGSKFPQPPVPTRSNTSQSDAKRPRLKVQIPNEPSGDEGGTASAPDEVSGSQPSTSSNQQHGPAHGVVLPPPSPSASALLSAGAQGPPNPFARPAPPMSTNPHAANRDVAAIASNPNLETPMSALPSRFVSDNLLPSPSTFYPEWGFGRSGENMLPSPLNFQTPVVANDQGWREENDASRKRPGEDGLEGTEGKKSKT